MFLRQGKRPRITAYIREQKYAKAIITVETTLLGDGQCCCHFRNFVRMTHSMDRLCGLVVRVSDCRSRGPGFDSRRWQIFCVAAGLERGPLGPCEDKRGAT
jgi:hypothetical protein